MTNVALALGSGGARGWAHIGVLQVLSERGYRVTSLAGTSVGSLVGGMYAAGHLDAFTEWVLTLSQRDVLRLFDVGLGIPGAMKLERVMAKVNEFLGDVRIEELPLPFTAVATDLVARREVWFQEGPLNVAIRASIAIPSVITPIAFKGRLLVDGGVLNPVPLAPLNSSLADVTVAVSLSGRTLTRPAPVLPGTDVEAEAGHEPEMPVRPQSELVDRIRGIAAGVVESGRNTISRFLPDEVERAFDDAPSAVSLLDVTTMSLDTVSSLITRYRLAGSPPDVLIELPANTCGMLEFHRAAELIAHGRRLTTVALDALEGVAPPALAHPDVPPTSHDAGTSA
ncbi:MAG: patatin-like phospholipase family protein [Propionibacteriaceae bacterium]|nr:patatin-like phospholipase family protein [Micropruina sp.]HBX81364.1 esterase [Propionibacteriaceae bacterium]